MNTPVDSALRDPRLVPYSKPQPWGMTPDIVINDVLTSDENLWAPVGDGIWSRPLQLNVTGGFYTHVLRVKRSGLLQRHRRSGMVQAYVIKGRWYYLEHDWVAEEGSYIFEPPGDVHTLVVEEGHGEMLTMFQIHGAMVYLDDNNAVTSVDDVFTRIDQCRAHFASVGLGADYVDQFVR